ncbi:beta-1,6-N-acetylglucosaminyltransferase [uncultured Succinivibrio sp.]|uniref:beta-1,6-N-acetylglucosaminyltransferase n=1 Tax=uncultured Succinivibrio sp. TaxID=540749 RepID=UPI0025DCAEA2|nr:beta-1,6-N-acetylglucosaminyltransferase [uncultured Succinivibrio sp.]
MKHAYLIMAHYRPDLLHYLIESIDDERNDIFIHIDKKNQNLTWNLSAKKASVFVISSKNIIWGSYSQIECEYRLLEAANKNMKYDYYHLLTGVTFPLKNQDYIHSFFKKNQGAEFIGFDNKKDYSFRAKYHLLFPNRGKRVGKIGSLLDKSESIYIKIQQLLGINRLNEENLIIKKGLAYFSITNDFVEYVLSQEKVIKKLLKGSICGDEVFIQTLAFNSDFRNKLYNFNDEYKGCLRLVPWDNNLPITKKRNKEFELELEDLPNILSSECLFAFKFDGPDGLQLIDTIKKASKI